jgi:hypothetical protein
MLLARGQDGRLGLASVEQEKLQPVQLVLKPARECVVRMKDAQGKPVANADVFFVANYCVLADGRSGADGRWTDRVPADATEWSVFARKAGAGFDYATARQSREPREVPRPLPEEVALVFDGVTKLRVRAVDQAGKPMSGVRVGLDGVRIPDHAMDVNLGGTWEFWPTTSADGSAVLDWLPKRFMYALSINAVSNDHYTPDPSTALLADKPVAEMVFTLLPFEQVSGRVVGADGRPVAGVRVTAWGSGSGNNGCHKTTRTDADGKYRMQVYAEQAYVVVAADGDRAAPYRTGILVHAGKPVRGVDFALGRATRVHGRITIGKENRPATGWASAHTVEHDIPKELRRPGDNWAHTVSMYFHSAIDAHGRFEFRLGPGDYVIRGLTRTHTAKVTIPAENPPAEIVQDFWMPAPLTGPLAGRVVDAAGQPVAGARVDGQYTMVNIGALFDPLKTDGQGRFATERTHDPLILHAVTVDGTRGGVARLDAEAANAEVVVGPLTTASGRLLDLNGHPVPARELTYGIRVWDGKPGKGCFVDSFGGVAKTDPMGRFSFTGLVPGEMYDVKLRLDEGGFRNATRVQPKDASPVDIGDVQVDPEPTKPYVPPTPAERSAAAFKASSGTAPRKRLGRLLAEARREYTRPLLLFGRPADPACVDLFRLFEETKASSAGTAESPAPSPEALHWEFELEALNTDRPPVQELAGELKVPAGPDAPPAMVVLDADGAVTETYPLRPNDKQQLDGKAVGTFLARHKPATRDAEQMLREALARAKSEGKRVFFVASGTWCPPCRRLSRFLDSQREELDRHYVFVKVDISRDRHGDACRKRIKGNDEGGVPWYAILDDTGKAIISSDAPEVPNDYGSPNIGYPSTAAEIDHFMKMLRQTAPGLSADKLAGLRTALAEKQ